MQEAGQSLPRARRGDDKEYFLPPIARPKVASLRDGKFSRTIINIQIPILGAFRGENTQLAALLT